MKSFKRVCPVKPIWISFPILQFCFSQIIMRPKILMKYFVPTINMKYKSCAHTIRRGWLLSPTPRALVLHDTLTKQSVVADNNTTPATTYHRFRDLVPKSHAPGYLTWSSIISFNVTIKLLLVTYQLYFTSRVNFQSELTIKIYF